MLAFILLEWEQNGKKMSTAPAGSKVSQNQLTKIQKLINHFKKLHSQIATVEASGYSH